MPSLTRSIDACVHDARGVAFVDLDRTLIHGDSIVPFLGEAVAAGVIRPGRLLADAREILDAGRGGLGPLLERFIGALRGQREATLVELGERAFRRRLAARIHPEARALIQAHRGRGHRVVIVTSATCYQALPVARALGIAPGDVLCTRLMVDGDGRLTGRWALPGCWNEGKRLLARAWLRRHGGCFEDAWFYTDSHEDLSLLERVGHPVVVNPDAELARRARLARWPRHRFQSRGPGLGSVVRTGLAVGSLYGAALTGASTLLFGGRVRDAVDVATRTWGRQGVAASGLRLRVRGEEHLRGVRPAVVVFNHQSALDALVMARLLKSDFTGVCKQELARDPVVGALFRAAGMVFVDRDARDGAAQLAPALAALRGGRTLAIAPEGVRSHGTRPGAFKRGAFYLARRARVPLVPVVIHNAADVLPRGAALLRSDIPIEVTVLPPLDAANWRARELGARAEALHARYLDLLGFASSGPFTDDATGPAAAPLRAAV